MPPDEAASDFNVFEVVASVGGAFLTFSAAVVILWRIARPHVQQLIRDTRATKRQVANDHDTNLRDDITALADQLDVHCREAHRTFELTERRLAVLEQRHRRWPFGR